MPFTIHPAGPRIELELSGAVTARHVGELAAQLLALATAESTLVLDAGQLEDVDTSVLQMLVSVRKAVSGFQIESASDAFVGAVDRCALRRELLAGARESL